MEPDVVEIAPFPVASGSRTRKPRKAVIPEVIDVEEYEFRNGGSVVNNVIDKKGKGKAIEGSSFTFSNIGSNPFGSLPKPVDLETYQDCYDHNPFGGTQYVANDVMEVDDYLMFQEAVDSSKLMQNDVEFMMPPPPPPWGLNSSSKGTVKSSRSSLRNGNPSFAAPVTKSWDFYSGSVLPPQNNQNIYSSSEWFSASVVQPKVPDIATFVPIIYASAPFSASAVVQPETVMVPDPRSKYDASASYSRPTAAEVTSSNVRKFKEKFLRDFKRFDTVDDFSDHHYASKGKTSKQHSKPWVKKVQEDWKILENDLPETIFVRACESRMDLLRAVIIGAEGTPYHDGLFFFDIQFPDTYPSVPPQVYYHSGGLRINPNLYNCGKVCLSLLGTWSGNTREKWIPKESTMLQLLVSIQALILNQNPYFNEPGYERTKGTPSGEAHSKVYSENVFILSLKTMVYSMKRPPKHFEEFVYSHFYVRAHDIVKACNAYKDGAPLGSMVKGGVQDVEETSQSGGSKKFRADVACSMKTVVVELVKVGVKELEEKPKPPPVYNANTDQSNNRKRGRSSSIKEFLANIGRCVFQQN